APPSPDYIHGPEEPEQAAPLPDYIPGPEHADDEIVAEDQSYAEDASPTAQSPEYVLDSNLEAYPEEDNDEDPEEDHVDYPANGGDDSDDKEGSSEDDDMDIEADEEEEEEHPAPANSVVVTLPAADQASSAEETRPFETDESAATPSPHLAYRMTARISISALIPVPAWSDSKVARLLAMSTPPSSPLSPLSLPPPRIPFPPLPPILSPPLHVLSPAPPPSTIRESSFAAAARLAGGLRADYGFVATMDREIKRDPKREVRYRIIDSWDEIVETLQGAPVSTDTELGGYIREFETKVRRDTDEIYSRLDDEQSERQL
nr:hypothetical protein [Tanacetum cinerariifolium]